MIENKVKVVEQHPKTGQLNKKEYAGFANRGRALTQACRRTTDGVKMVVVTTEGDNRVRVAAWLSPQHTR